MSAYCRTSDCRASIVWATTAAGKRMPLDIEPVADTSDLRGLFTLDPPPAPHEQATPRARRAYPEDAEQGKPLYTSHFATCPAANQHRGAKAGATPGGGLR